ncbi:hypothetical protein DFH08DRAFT_918887 [Mycena albidolilacea]|uniref:Integrase core domain-containing protein n=1 Tax=Mycena albidolilacea TaxID=1033008 RepID=A0AAD6Z0R9_9AGAR|nr:hypothetical protein DFH08DRAFT_918887 [Mycena albidolilacea]
MEAHHGAHRGSYIWGRSVHNVHIERLWVDVTAQAWNQHRIQIRNSTNHSPTDMFVFDMYANGVRGDQLPPEEENLNEEELEVYGIDEQGLRDNGVLQSQAQNNLMGEGSSSWVGWTGPPPDLSQVAVQPPTGTLTEEEVTKLYSSFSHLFGSAEDPDIISLWTQASLMFITRILSRCGDVM